MYYSTQLYTERKFRQNAELDVRIRTSNEMVAAANEKIAKLKSRLHKYKGWMKDTDKHLK
jgi:hypothetical protein